PRRCVLRRRIARIRPTASRTVRVRIQSAKRPSVDRSGTAAHVVDDREPGCEARRMSRLMRIWRWFDARLQIGRTIADVADHPVPTRSASWWYVFGSGALTLFALQIVTGVLLATVYVPSAAEAWNSLQHLDHGVTLGWFLRAMHGWGSNF